jgi:hypothetical protein
VPEAAPFMHRVLPDGCADLLFDLETARRVGGTPADLIGPMSRALVFEMRGPADMLAFGSVPAPSARSLESRQIACSTSRPR